MPLIFAATALCLLCLYKIRILLEIIHNDNVDRLLELNKQTTLLEHIRDNTWKGNSK